MRAGERSCQGKRGGADVRQVTVTGMAAVIVMLGIRLGARIAVRGRVVRDSDGMCVLTVRIGEHREIHNALEAHDEQSEDGKLARPSTH